MGPIVADARARQLRSVDTRRQSDAQQFWRQDLCRRRTTSLEQSAAQSQTMWAVIRPVQAVTEDIFILIHTLRPRRSVNCFLTAPNRNILTYYLLHLRGMSPEVIFHAHLQARSQGAGGRSGRTTPPPVLKCHFSADCSSANILNITRL